MLFDLFLNLLTLSGLVFTLMGLGLFIQFFRAKRPPMDDSNIFNHARLVWFSVTRPDKFAEYFPWMKNDEWENFHD